jgi:hypothetical protein
MIQDAWTFLAIKLVSVPIFIWAVSIVGRRWGHSLGGLIVGLPLTSGPVLLFLALEQGNSFVVAASQGTLLGLISLSTSCLVYSRLSFGRSWRVSLAGGCVTYFAVALLLNFLSAPLALSFVVVVAFLVLISMLLPSGTVEIVSRGPLKWEIPMRMITATAVVLLITEGATILGPHLSGLLTTFPAYASVLAVFTHRFDGAAASSLFLRGVVTGTLASAVFFFLLASFIMRLGLSIAFGLALLAAMTLQYFLFCYLRKGYG